MASIYTPAQVAVAKEIWDFWRENKCSEIQAAAWCAMADGESSFDPRVIGDHGAAYGLFQIHHNPRGKFALQNLNIDIRHATVAEQLHVARWEITSGWQKHAWKRLLATETVEDAVAVLISGYEMSAKQARDIARRTVMAAHWLKEFGEVA